MLILNLKDQGSIEKALKNLKRKFEQTGTIKELRKRKEFIKPGEVRRNQILKAKNIQRFKDLHDDK